jgi:peptidoglycan glycosyltransferase
VNQPITRLFVVVMVLFGGLAVMTSWWTVVKADELNTEMTAQNKRELLRGLKIRRGVIRDADGGVIARSVRDADGIYSRTYPEHALFGHPVGYSRAGLDQSGLEAFRNAPLSGREDGLTTAFEQLTGKRREGEDVRTHLDPEAQKQATDLIARAGKSGSAVALDPRTGAVRVMVSTPGYDPDAVRDAKSLGRLNRDEERKPLVNRALQFGEAPGSTMKVVTATAAVDSGKFRLDSRVDGRNARPISGVPLANDFNEDFGQVDLVTAMAKSVNTAWAGVAEDVGKKTMREYMRRFGFESKPELDYPRDAMSASGEYRNGDLLPATSRFVDVGRMGIGQDKLSVTTLQMAQVAAAVANGGTLMKPRITDRILDRDGRTTEKIDPEVQDNVMSSDSAAAVRAMMEAVVESGTGTAAKLPGIQVAGKTGTAETQFGKKINDVWFIAFAPSRDPRIAIAVNVQDVPGFGGEVAAPIARDVMATLLKKDAG